MRIILSLLLLFPVSAYSQTLRLDEPFPIAAQTPQLQKMIRAHQGIPILLDLFSSTCTACFTAMPKLQSLQHHFGKQLQIILVGHTDQKIQKVYERISKHYGLNLPVVYDSLLHPQTGATGFPTSVWIDAQGITRGITYSTSVTEETLQDFINGNAPKQQELKDSHKAEPEADAPGSAKKYIMQGSIALWQPGDLIQTRLPVDPVPDTLRLSRVPLQVLYRIAFFHSLYWPENSPLYLQQYNLPLIDSAGILTPVESDLYYTYFMSFSNRPVSDSAKFTYMQQDLERAFGYYARLENRMVPYWRLRVAGRDSIRLITKGGLPVDQSSDIGFKGQNISIDALIQALQYYNPYGPIFVDETGIIGKIDLTVDAILTDIPDVQRALTKKGLILEQGIREMKVIVLYRKEKGATSRVSTSAP